MNANATRFSSLFSVDFDSAGHLASASLQAMMLEKTRYSRCISFKYQVLVFSLLKLKHFRVVRRPEGEPNFNVFYQMLAGVDSALRCQHVTCSLRRTLT